MPIGSTSVTVGHVIGPACRECDRAIVASQKTLNSAILPLFLWRERHTQEKFAGGENFVVGVLQRDAATLEKRDTAAAKCTGFLGGDAASRLL